MSRPPSRLLLKQRAQAAQEAALDAAQNAQPNLRTRVTAWFAAGNRGSQRDMAKVFGTTHGTMDSLLRKMEAVKTASRVDTAIQVCSDGRKREAVLWGAFDVEATVCGTPGRRWKQIENESRGTTRANEPLVARAVRNRNAIEQAWFGGGAN